MSDRKVYIYTLRDSEDGEVRYVGQTIAPDARLKSHLLTNELRSGNAKREWIEGVLGSGGDIEMDIIEECDHCVAQDREQHWIDFYMDSGASLTNTRKAIPSNAGRGRRGDLRLPISFRPTSMDARVLGLIHENNPIFTNGADLIRIALQEYLFNNRDEL